MPDYVVTTSPSEEEALQWVASQSGNPNADPPVPPQTADEYFQARMHDVLHSYEQQHAVATAVAPVDDVAVAYAQADSAIQAQVANTLGMQVSKPA